MPKLMLFVACEKAIIDKDNNLSLISLFSELKAEISEAEITAAIPSEQKAMIPLRWDAVSMWLRAEGDDDGERVRATNLLA